MFESYSLVVDAMFLSEDVLPRLHPPSHCILLATYSIPIENIYIYLGNPFLYPTSTAMQSARFSDSSEFQSTLSVSSQSGIVTSSRFLLSVMLRPLHMNSFLTGSVGGIPHHVLEGGPSRDKDIQLVDVDVTMEAIYASPKLVFPEALWQYVRQLGTVIEVLWLLVGGFNQVLSEEDKLGGRAISWRKTKSLLDTLDACSLFDLGIFGSQLFALHERFDSRSLFASSSNIPKSSINREILPPSQGGKASSLFRATSFHRYSSLRLPSDKSVCWSPFHIELELAHDHKWEETLPPFSSDVPESHAAVYHVLICILANGRDIWQNAWPPALEATPQGESSSSFPSFVAKPWSPVSESACVFLKNPTPMDIWPGRPSLSAGASQALSRFPIRCLDVSYTPRGSKRAYGLALPFHLPSRVTRNAQ
ncbi:hypothetical protein M9H77_28199 [Catharanthus roseus]|uniref:Uncharacterized protein n=1 Tax=Catharanthus roseus TaxID=4058 RepID=A0ACC0AFN4_CATRO|nr:hypothetical protein M9H77_28199 [Catharanthus roseus]